MIFPATVSPEERRQIHILAHYMGLEHRSVGDADARQIQVLKPHVPSPTGQAHAHAGNSVNLELHRRGLSRAATFDFAADRESRVTGGNYPHAVGRQGPTLELPGSPDGVAIPNNLRAAKSFADLRSFSPSPSHSMSGYLNPGGGMGGMPGSTLGRLGEYTGSLSQANSSVTPTLTPTSPGTVASQGSSNEAAVLAGTLSSLSLGSFESGPGPAQQNRSTPGAIGSHRPSANGSGRGMPDRQPRGPEWETSSGFGGRRVNGHMQRPSGKSMSSLPPDQMGITNAAPQIHRMRRLVRVRAPTCRDIIRRPQLDHRTPSFSVTRLTSPDSPLQSTGPRLPRRGPAILAFGKGFSVWGSPGLGSARPASSAPVLF